MKRHPPIDDEGKPSLGPIIRGLRLGWGYVHRWKAWMKIVDDGPDAWRVIFRPVQMMPGGHPDGEPFRAWWSGPDIAGLLSSIPQMQHVTRVKRPFELRVKA